MKKLGIIAVVILASITAEAQQDRHFSMFFASPVQLNPGAAGHGMGTLQLFTNFRTQWFTVSSQPFRSFSASVDGKMFEKSLSNGFFGAGINFLNDVSGDAKYTMNIINAPINYSLEIMDNHYLSLGIQPGWYMQSLNEGALYFDNQWTGGGFNTSMSNGENLGTFNSSSFDFSSGIFFNAMPKDNFNYQVGISGFHLTAQEVSFYNLSEKLYRNFTVYSAFNIWPDGKKLSYHPAFFSMFQGPNFEFTIGNNFEYELKPSSRHTGYFDGMSLSLGVYYRSSDALMANLIYNAGSLSFGACYDINLSGLTIATKSVGAVEAYLRFTPVFDSKYSGAPSIF